MHKLISGLLWFFHDLTREWAYNHSNKLLIDCAKYIAKKYNVLVQFVIYYEEGYDPFIYVEDTPITRTAEANRWKDSKLPFCGPYMSIVLYDRETMEWIGSHTEWHNVPADIVAKRNAEMLREAKHGTH